MSEQTCTARRRSRLAPILAAARAHIDEIAVEQACRAVRRYLGGWMASGNYAHLQDSGSVVEFYGAVAIHDHRQSPPTLAAIDADRRKSTA